MPRGTAGFMRLPRDRIALAADMLARSFRQDPRMTYFAPDTKGRFVLSRQILEFELMYGVLYGEVYATSPGLEGVAVWLPSEKAEISLWRAMRAGALRRRRTVGTDAMKKILSFSKYVDGLHREHVPTPHWYLSVMGVDPAYQGEGYASRLIRPMLAQLDREGMPCYLVTQNEQNVPLYERYGFAVAGRSTVPDTDVAHIEMLREAAG